MNTITKNFQMSTIGAEFASQYLISEMSETTKKILFVVNFGDQSSEVQPSLIYDSTDEKKTLTLRNLGKKMRDIILNNLFDAKIFDYQLKTELPPSEAHKQGRIETGSVNEISALRFK